MNVVRGDVDPGDLPDLPQEVFLGKPPPLGLAVAVHDLHGALLALAQREEVDEVRQRLRVVGAGPSRKDNIM